MATLSDTRFLKIIGILILFFLVLGTALLISLHFELRQSAPSASHSEEMLFPSALPSPAETTMEAGPVTKSAPLASLRQISSKPVTPNHYMREEAKTPPLKEEMPAPIIVQEAASPEPLLTVARAPSISIAQEPKREEIAIPAGAVVTVRLLGTLDSQNNRAGDRFSAVRDEPLYANGRIVLPRGGTVEGHVKQVQEAGRVSGLSEITLELDRLLLNNGQWIEIVTDTLTKQGESSRGKDAATVGAGAAIGAAIGAIAGGRRGAGIGAATGAGASTAQVLLTRGKPVILSPETRLSFQLRVPLHLSFSSSEEQIQALQLLPDSSTADSNNRQSDWERPRLIRRR
ncbi:MAG: hypothetical protein HY313_02965 [Acidobacteria bacterium]|nr:hypothetical protein [Acidobacteriota bacterium]